jgi:hypothetical protein
VGDVICVNDSACGLAGKLLSAAAIDTVYCASSARYEQEITLEDTLEETLEETI